MKRKIINLHNHSQYSVLDGLGTPDEIVKKTIEFGLPAVAITDHGNMNNFANFYLAAKKNKIKPIFGCEFYHIKDLNKWKKYLEKTQELRKNKEGSREEKKERNTKLRSRNHLILLAKNKIGLENLNMLVYHSYNNLYFKPRIDYELIKKYSKGLICSSACLAGQIPQLLLEEKEKEAIKTIEFFKSIFKDDYYIEIQFNELEHQQKVNPLLIDIAKKESVKVIITQDSHYLDSINNTTHQSLLLLQTKSTYEELEDRKDEVFQFKTKELYYKNYDELLDSMLRFNKDISKKQFEEFAENTFEIEDKIENFEIDREIKLKDIYPDINNKNDYLEKLCKKGLINKKLEKKEYYERLKFELNIIKKKNFSNYFLIVSKIVNDAKKKMCVGAGRGSGSGSLINYLLGITDIDPLKYDLYFERFLNLDREDPPDIDIDFENNDIIKQDLINKYPNDVACITSYSTFQLAGLLRDLGKIYNIEDSNYFIKLNKAIKFELKENYYNEDDDSNKVESITFDEAYKFSHSFKKFMDKHEDIARDMKVLLNQIRHIGKHAAGVVICDDLIKKQPTMVVKDILQTSMTEGVKENTLSKFGFVKIDILGLKTLGLLHNTIKYISKDTGEKEEKIYKKIHPDNIDLEDEKIYNKIFLKNNLFGIFQFETSTAKPLIVATKPNCFEDLVAMNALNRPGPLQGGLAYDYGLMKRGEKEPNYFNNDIVEKVLGRTHGIVIYQEQVMELGHYLANLTLEETNKMRKLIAKQNKIEGELKEELNKMKKKFVHGSIQNGMNMEDSIKIWDMMEKFSSYGFNRAHAVAYAMIAYQCAWLKTYYPIQFYTSLLNMEDYEHYARVINEIIKNKIEVRPINLNKSNIDFHYEKNVIYWGLSKVIGIGDKASEEIVRIRKEREIEGLKDFTTREKMNYRVCNKRVINTLIKIGAFEKLEKKRKYALEVFDNYINNKGKNSFGTKKWNELTSIEKFDNAIKKTKKEYKGSLDFTEKEKIKIELEAYKINLIHSPFKLESRKNKIKKLLERGKAGGFSDDSQYFIVEFKNVKRFFDRRGNEMAFLDLQDIYGEVKRGIIFSSNYIKDLIKENSIYCINGEIKDKMIIDVYKNIDYLS